MTLRTRTRLGDEAKFELALSAASRERANRPLILVVLASALLVGSAGFAAYAVTTRASRRADLARALEDQAWAEAKVEEWKKLGAAEQTQPENAGVKGEFKVSKMEDLAIRAEMKSKPNAPVTRDDKSRQGVVVYSHIYTEVRDPSLAHMIEWVRSACAEIAGLEVEALTVRPEPAGWKMDVTFRRWERAGT